MHAARPIYDSTQYSSGPPRGRGVARNANTALWTFVCCLALSACTLEAELPEEELDPSPAPASRAPVSIETPPTGGVPMSDYNLCANEVCEAPYPESCQECRAEAIKPCEARVAILKINGKDTAVETESWVTEDNYEDIAIFWIRLLKATPEDFHDNESAPEAFEGFDEPVEISFALDAGGSDQATPPGESDEDYEVRVEQSPQSSASLSMSGSSGTVLFPPGETEVVLVVRGLADDEDESSESFSISLREPLGEPVIELLAGFSSQDGTIKNRSEDPDIGYPDMNPDYDMDAGYDADDGYDMYYDMYYDMDGGDVDADSGDSGSDLAEDATQDSGPQPDSSGDAGDVSTTDQGDGDTGLPDLPSTDWGWPDFPTGDAGPDVSDMDMDVPDFPTGDAGPDVSDMDIDVPDFPSGDTDPDVSDMDIDVPDFPSGDTDPDVSDMDIDVPDFPSGDTDPDVSDARVDAPDSPSGDTDPDVSDARVDAPDFSSGDVGADVSDTGGPQLDWGSSSDTGNPQPDWGWPTDTGNPQPDWGGPTDTGNPQPDWGGPTDTGNPRPDWGWPSDMAGDSSDADTDAYDASTEMGDAVDAPDVSDGGVDALEEDADHLDDVRSPDMTGGDAG